MTRMAFIDPTDRYLPLWKPNPYDSRFTLRHGVPEPFVRACLFAVPFDESERRWGSDGRDPDTALQYLLDRELLSSTTSRQPICAAFQNYFTDGEIFSTIRIEENSNGRFYVWETLESLSALQIRHGFLIMDTPYPVFKLTGRAHELLDVGKTDAVPATPADGENVDGAITDGKPSAQRKPSHTHAKNSGGRPLITGEQARKREALVQRWNRAKSKGVRQKDFCGDGEVTLEHLTKCINWVAQRHRRGKRP